METAYSTVQSESVLPVNDNQHAAEAKHLMRSTKASFWCALSLVVLILLSRLAHAVPYTTAATGHLKDSISLSDSNEEKCIGAFNTSAFNVGTLCFCAYTWHGLCLADLNLTVQKTPHEDEFYIKLDACCSDSPLSNTPYSATFFALGTDGQDLLVIPVRHMRDISVMKHCPDALQLLSWLLSQGRKDFVKFKVGGKDSPPPEWQCVHLPYYTSVDWLHVHNFIGSMPSQYLPGTPENGAVCVYANITNVTEAAEKMLEMVPRHVPMPSWWTPPVPWYTSGCESWERKVASHVDHFPAVRGGLVG